MSGTSLGEVACNSAVREFYLDGNKLECRGLSDMISEIAVAAENDHMKRIEEEKLKALIMAEGAMQGLMTEVLNENTNL